MKKFNLPVRLKNPVFWIQVIGAFIMCGLTYNQLQPQDLTTWSGVANLLLGTFKNPYLLVMCLWNVWSAANDPTVCGLIKDSNNAMQYTEPKKD